MAGTLYVVASPIGNLGDLSLRALEVLRGIDVVAAEDTRRTRALLTHFGISGKRLASLHAHSSAGEVEGLLRTLAGGESIALLTDAGTPSVSDPGDSLVRAAIDAGHAVVPLPGASAVLAALVGSGLTGGGGFRFFGFLPRDGTARQTALRNVCNTPETAILFEAPNRTEALLRDLAERQPTRPACVARELTKMHEEFVRGTLQQLAQPRPWRGEIAVVLGPFVVESEEPVPEEARLDARIDQELAAGTHPKTIADKLAAWARRPRRELYARVVERKQR